MQHEPLLVLVGPTAVGKTSLALTLAQELDAEIVNVDSRQIYRYMDIGTAKPTAAQRAQVPHHLLDLLFPDQRTNAAQFVTAARQVFASLQQRGKRPLVVAGSGLYLQALLFGLMPVPAANDALRQELHAYADRHGTPALHRCLRQVDPVAATWYHPHDRVRLVRALEVTYLTGEPFSSHCQRHQQQRQGIPYLGIGLTRNRADLYARIASRTEAMLAAGWLNEVEMLLARGYTRDCPAMNSLGYRELVAYLAQERPWHATVEAIKTATRHFAKRQLTWFRKVPALVWLDLSLLREEEAIEQVLSQWDTCLNTQSWQRQSDLLPRLHMSEGVFPV